MALSRCITRYTMLQFDVVAKLFCEQYMCVKVLMHRSKSDSKSPKFM